MEAEEGDEEDSDSGTEADDEEMDEEEAGTVGADQELEEKYRAMVVKGTVSDSEESEENEDEEEEEDEEREMADGTEEQRLGFPLNRVQKESKEFMQVATIDDFQFFEKVSRGDQFLPRGSSGASPGEPVGVRHFSEVDHPLQRGHRRAPRAAPAAQSHHR